MAGIYGLSGSGMDVDAMVKSMMKAQQMRYDTLQQKKTQLEWKKSDYNSLYTSLNSFRSTTVLNNKLQATLAPKVVSSSNELAVTATANAEAGSGSHSIDVIQLAESVRQVSSSAITESGFKKGTLTEQFGVSGNFTVRISNGSAAKDIMLNATDSMNDVVSKINNAGINVNASYDANLDRFFISTANSGEKATLNFSGSSSKGFDFITNKLKLPSALTTVDTTGVTSGGAVFSSAISADTTLFDNFGLVGDAGKFKLQITKGVGVNKTQTTLEFDASKDTLSTFVDKITKSGIGAQASYDSWTGKVTITAVSGTLDFSGSDATAIELLQTKLKLPSTTVDATGVTSSGTISPIIGSTSTLKNAFSDLPTSNFNLKINGTDDISIDPNGTVQDFINQLKANANVDASSGYDETTGILTLKAAAGKTLNFTGSDTGALDLLINKFKLNSLTQQKGQDAIVNFDGITGVHESSNSFTISGVTYSLKGKTVAGTPASVVVSSDIEGIVKNVKSFVDEYNKILAKVNLEINEAKYKTYLPLTEDQRANMKDTEITAWELKAKSGMLRNDSILRSLVNTMRNDISAKVSGLTGDYTSASNLGLNTSKDLTEDGLLHLDEAQLRKALQDDPAIVSKIFSTSQDGNTHGQNGIATRLYDTLKTVSDRLATEAGTAASTTSDTQSNVAKQIATYTKNMTKMNARLTEMQKNYYTKFNAMEVALSKLNQQSTWLTQQTS